MRYPPVGPSNRSAPWGSDGEAANTGSPAIPASRYTTWAAIPSRAPRTTPPSSTTIGCNVNGTGVNGRGMLTCAAAAVSAGEKQHGSDADPGLHLRAPDHRPEQRSIAPGTIESNIHGARLYYLY